MIIRMRLREHSHMICLLSLMMVSWKQPGTAYGWDLSRYSGGYHPEEWNSRFYQKPPPHIYSLRGRGWNNNYRDPESTEMENPRNRHNWESQFAYPDATIDLLYRRMYDDHYSGPQNLGDAEVGKSKSRISIGLKSVESPRDNRRKYNKLLFKRRKRGVDNVEITTIAVNEEKNSKALLEIAGPNTKSGTGGGNAGKRPTAVHGVKGRNPGYGPVKSSAKKNATHVSHIIFPNTRNSFTPEDISCSAGSTYCEDVKEYPSNYIQSILTKDDDKYSSVFGEDTILEPKISLRGNQDEIQLCTSSQQIIYPRQGKTKDDKWLFIVNLNRYKQGILVETCINPDKSCQKLEGIPLGYRTFCKQKFIIRRLLSLNESGSPAMNEFLFPSCCTCVTQLVPSRDVPN